MKSVASSSVVDRAVGSGIAGRAKLTECVDCHRSAGPTCRFGDRGRICNSCRARRFRERLTTAQRAVIRERQRRNDKERYAAKRNEILAAKRSRYQANPEAFLSRQREYRRQNPEKHHAQTRKAKYGLTSESFERLWNQQDGKCAICLTPLARGPHAHIDHCHGSGRVRGILCSFCNHGLGRFRDQPTLLIAAAKYLTANADVNASRNIAREGAAVFRAVQSMGASTSVACGVGA